MASLLLVQGPLPRWGPGEKCFGLKASPLHCYLSSYDYLVLLLLIYPSDAVTHLAPRSINVLSLWSGVCFLTAVSEHLLTPFASLSLTVLLQVSIGVRLDHSEV